MGALNMSEIILPTQNIRYIWGVYAYSYFPQKGKFRMFVLLHGISFAICEWENSILKIFP